MISFVNSNGNPNIGQDIETPWIPTTSPNYDYLEINGAEEKPKMTYDPDLKNRSLFWSKLFKTLQNHHLSDKPVKTSLEIAQEFNFRIKDEL